MLLLFTVGGFSLKCCRPQISLIRDTWFLCITLKGHVYSAVISYKHVLALIYPWWWRLRCLCFGPRLSLCVSVPFRRFAIGLCLSILKALKRLTRFDSAFFPWSGEDHGKGVCPATYETGRKTKELNKDATPTSSLHKRASVLVSTDNWYLLVGGTNATVSDFWLYDFVQKWPPWGYLW